MRTPAIWKGRLARIVTSVLALVALTITTAAPSLALAGSNVAASATPRRQYDHIFVIVEENTEYGDIIGNPKAPTLNQLANRYGLATEYFGATHPSEPNYVAMVGGSFYGIADDGPYNAPSRTINQPSIVDQLEGAGLSWKGYFQNMPTAGYTGTCYPTTGPCLYASKHNGFINFAHVQNSPAELNKLVPDTNLGDDLANGTAPNLAFIAPDQCHDLHGIGGTCTGDQLLAQTDAYLKTTVDEIMWSDMWRRGHNAIVVTFDEGSTNLGCCDANSGGGRVVTVVIRNNQQRPMQDATPYNHYSLVATIQAAFGLGCRFDGTAVGFTCDSANGVKPMAPLFDLR